MEDLIPFAQFQKRKEHPWCSVTFSIKSAELSIISDYIPVFHKKSFLVF